MELARLRRIIAARWRVILVAVVASSIVAGVGASQRNAAIRPVLVVTMSIDYERDPLDSTGDQRTAMLQQASRRAVEATKDLVLTIPGADISIDSELGQMKFTAEGATQEEAEAGARTLLDAFVTSEEEAITKGIDEELQSIEEEILGLRQQIEGLSRLTPEEIAHREQLEALRALKAEYEAAASALRTERVNPGDERPVEEIEADLSAVESEILDLELEIATLESETSESRSRADILLGALTSQVQALEAYYTELFLRQSGFARDGEIGPTITEDATPTTLSIGGLAFLGMIAGVVFGIGGLIASERFRPMVWMSGDVRSVPALGLVPSRPPHDGRSWYLEASAGARKSAIQRLRSLLEARLKVSKVVALASLSADDDELAMVALDVAASLTVTGRRVLVVDPTSSNPGSEYGPIPVTIADLLVDPGTAERRLESLEVNPGLYVLSAGRAVLDADAAVSTRFRLLLDRLTQRFDAVVMVAGPADGTVGRSLLQQAPVAVIATPPGGVARSEFDVFVADLKESGVSLAGLLLLGSPSYRSIGVDIVESHADERPTPMGAPGPRSTPGSAPASRSAGSESEDVLILQLIETLEESEPYRVVDAVELFLAERLQAAVVAAARDFEFSHEGEPFIWVGPGSTIEISLRRDLAAEFGSTSADALVEAFLGVLWRSLSIESLEEWTQERFFDTLLRENPGEPRVWYLTESLGGFGVIVDGDRFDGDHLGSVRDRVMETIASVESELRKLDRDERHRAEAMIENLQVFGLKLGLLLEGSAPEAQIRYPDRQAAGQPRGWRPDFAESRAAHLVPLQRLGLLLRPVLSEETLDRYVAV